MANVTAHVRKLTDSTDLVTGCATHKLSRHARKRVQQRSIDRAAIELVIGYGKRKRSHGADKCFLTVKRRQDLKRDIGPNAYRQLGHKLDIYVVLAENQRVISVMHRIRRVRA